MKFYLCDRKKCENCSPGCHHTSDISHALHPDAKDEDFAFLPEWAEKDENGKIFRMGGKFIRMEKDGEVEKQAAEIEEVFGPFCGLET